METLPKGSNEVTEYKAETKDKIGVEKLTSAKQTIFFLHQATIETIDVHQGEDEHKDTGVSFVFS